MIRWTAPEFEYVEKSDWWYWTLIAAAAILSAVSLWQKNILFLIFIIIAALLVTFLAKEKPKSLDFGLDNEGLLINKKFYDYKTFSSFAVKDQVLQFKNKSRWRLYLNVPIPENQREAIKKYLLAFLPEVEYNESTIDALTKLLRF